MSPTDLTLLETLLGLIATVLLITQAWVMGQIHQIKITLASKQSEYDQRIRALETDVTDLATRLRSVEMTPGGKTP